MENLTIWNNPNEVRKQFAKDLNETEFNFFLGLGKALNANPFTREIWAVKFGNGPASIFCGRDFYRKKAQEQPDYNGHLVDAVYVNDKFSVLDGKPQHTYNIADRGKLIGAYAIVRRKGIDQPYFVLVKFDEYNKGFSNWKSMPETMIKKVAEAQALRGAYQGVFAGTYDESEKWSEETKEVEHREIKQDTILIEQHKPQLPNDRYLKLLALVLEGDEESLMKACDKFELTEEQSKELKKAYNQYLDKQIAEENV